MQCAILAFVPRAWPCYCYQLMPYPVPAPPPFSAQLRLLGIDAEDLPCTSKDQRHTVQRMLVSCCCCCRRP